MSDINLIDSHILINKGDIIHDSRDSKSQISPDILKKILPYVYTYLTDYTIKNNLEYEQINKLSHERVRLILLDNKFGLQNRYRFTDLKNITIVSDITPVIFKKDIFSILPSEITKTFNDNVNPAKYITSNELKIIDTPATYIDPASRFKDTINFIPSEGVVNINTNQGKYDQKIKINFTSNFNIINKSLEIKIELTDSNLAIKNIQPLLSCMVNKDGEIIEFLKDNNVPTKNTDGNYIQYFSGNKQKNDYIQQEFNLSPQAITNKLKPGPELNKVLLLFACKELGDTMQSLIIKYFYENSNNKNVNEVKINNSCLFTSDTWCAARARLNRVPVLLRNADKTLSIYSPLTEQEFIRSIVVTNVQNVKKNNNKILQFLKNVIFKFNIETTGTSRRQKNIYKELIFETTKTKKVIQYKENIRNVFIKIYIFIYFSLYICELILEKNKTELLELDKIKNTLSFLTATSPILSYNNGKEIAYLNGLIKTIFNIKLYNNNNINYLQQIIGNNLISIIYNFSINNYVDIPNIYFYINIPQENTIKNFIDSIPNLNEFEFTKDDIIYNVGFGNYLSELPNLSNSSQVGGVLTPVNSVLTPLSGDQSFNKKRGLETPEKSPTSMRNTRKKRDLNYDPPTINNKSRKRRKDDEELSENDEESFNSKILKESTTNEKEFPDKIIYEVGDESLILQNYGQYNLTTYSIYSILYNYLLEFPSLYTYFEENLNSIIIQILKYEDFITLEQCIKINQEYEVKTLDLQIDSNDLEEPENYRNIIVYNFLNMINQVLVNIGKTGGKYSKLKTRKKYKKNKKKKTKKKKKLKKNRKTIANK